MKAAKSVEELEKNVHHMEHLVKRYDAISKIPLDEAVKTAVLVNLCPNEYKDYSDLTTQDYSYKDMKAAISNWMERKRDRDPAALRRLERVQTSAGQTAQPMDVDYLRHYHEWDPWWKQDEWEVDYVNNSFYVAEDHTAEKEWDLHAIHKGKGKGQRTPYVAYDRGGKGKNGGKGKGPQEYQGKGKGKKGGKGGKGSKGVFNGECYHCGEWGHSQRWCEQRLAEEQRGKGSAYVMEERAQEFTEGQGKLEALEERSGLSGSWRCVKHVLGSLETFNRFGPLAADEDEDGNCEEEKGALKTTDEPEREIPTYKHMLNSVDEINYMSKGMSGLEITVDSGASENVMGPSMAPSIPMSASPGSRAGVEYLAANGATMRNQGEKIVPLVTKDGVQCDLKMQITDVKRPLMSVARICDAGHRVTFDSNGGVIESLDGRVKVPFSRMNNVYRLCVHVDDQKHFQRQG